MRLLCLTLETGASAVQYVVAVVRVLLLVLVLLGTELLPVQLIELLADGHRVTGQALGHAVLAVEVLQRHLEAAQGLGQ